MVDTILFNHTISMLLINYKLQQKNSMVEQNRINHTISMYGWYDFVHSLMFVQVFYYLRNMAVARFTAAMKRSTSSRVL